MRGILTGLFPGEFQGDDSSNCGKCGATGDTGLGDFAAEFCGGVTGLTGDSTGEFCGTAAAGDISVTVGDVFAPAGGVFGVSNAKSNLTGLINLVSLNLGFPKYARNTCLL